MASQYDIVVRVDTSRVDRGLRQVDRSLDRAQRSADRLSGALRRAFAFLGGAALLRQFVSMADAMTNLENRLRTVTSSAEELAAVQDRLFQVAQETRAPLEATVELYARMATSADELGLSTDRLLGVTRTLNQAVALSGATATEGANAIRQLAQGMSAGALRGEELNSVLENLPTVADLIAEHLGVTRGRLRELAEEGRLTTGVLVGAFERAADRVGDDFGGSVQTVDQALTKLRNSLLKLVGDFDDATGASTTLADAISLLADNLGLVATALSGVALAVAGGALLRFLRSFVPAIEMGEALIARVRMVTRDEGVIESLEKKVVRLDSPLKRLIGTLRNLLGPLAWLARFSLPAAVFAGLFALVSRRDEIALTSGGLVTLGDAMRGLWDVLSRWTVSTARGFVDAVEDMLRAVRDYLPWLDRLIGHLEKINELTRAGLRAAGRRVLETLGDSDAARAAAAERLRFRFVPEGVELPSLPEAPTTAPPPPGGTGRQEESALVRANRELDRQLELLTMGRQEQERRLQLWDVEDGMRKAGLALGEREKAALEARIGMVQSLTTTVRAATDAMETTLNHIGDAFVDFAVTGKTSFKDMADAIIRDLLRIATQAFVIKPLLEFGQGAAGSLLGGGAGGGLGAGGSIGSIVGGLLGFEDGGRFVVGGAGGVDSQLVAFRATPGESVSVRTPAQDRYLETLMAQANRPQQQREAPAPVQVVVQETPVRIVNNTGEPVTERRTRGEGGEDIREIVIGTVRGGLSDGSLDGPLSKRFGVGLKPRRR